MRASVLSANNCHFSVRFDCVSVKKKKWLSSTAQHIYAMNVWVWHLAFKLCDKSASANKRSERSSKQQIIAKVQIKKFVNISCCLFIKLNTHTQRHTEQKYSSASATQSTLLSVCVFASAPILCCLHTYFISAWNIESDFQLKCILKVVFFHLATVNVYCTQTNNL